MTAQQERAIRAEEIIRQLVADGCTNSSEYGPDCFWCMCDRDEPHIDGCVYVAACTFVGLEVQKP